MLNRAVLLSPFCCFRPTLWILSLLWANFTIFHICKRSHFCYVFCVSCDLRTCLWMWLQLPVNSGSSIR